MSPNRWNWKAKNWTTKNNLIQNAVNKVEQKDIIRLLEKVSQNPGIVKTALKFI